MNNTPVPIIYLDKTSLIDELYDKVQCYVTQSAVKDMANDQLGLGQSGFTNQKALYLLEVLDGIKEGNCCLSEMKISDLVSAVENVIR